MLSCSTFPMHRHCGGSTVRTDWGKEALWQPGPRAGAARGDVFRASHSEDCLPPLHGEHNSRQHQLPAFCTIRVVLPIYFTRAFSGLFTFMHCSPLPRLPLQVLVFRRTPGKVADNKAAGTGHLAGQEDNSPRWRMAATALKTLPLQSQHSGTSKGNFKKEHL